MFDFHKLEAYNKARALNSRLEEIIIKIKNPNRRDQLLRASLSIQLNLAEGTGRFTRRDKRNFYIISRSSIFECVAILDVLYDRQIIGPDEYGSYYNDFEELSKMIFSLIKRLSD